MTSLRRASELLNERVSTASTMDDQDRAARLKTHVDEFLIPRALDLTTPLVVVLLGSTGAGKSSLFNTLVGQDISKTGVVRPTTMKAIVTVHPDDGTPLALDDLAALGAAKITTTPQARRGLILVDSPDFDSVETENRELARTLLELADLIVYVTTDTRYADDVPWQILRRARQRGVPLMAIVNRLPHSEADARAILSDFRRLIEENELSSQGVDNELIIVPVSRDELDPGVSGLSQNSVEPLIETLDRLMEDDKRRKQLAEQALGAAMAGITEPLREIAMDALAEGETAAELVDEARQAYARAREQISEEMDRGTFLRAEVLREWQEFVGANRVTRVISEGIGRIAATIRSIFDPGPEGEPTRVRTSALQDLTALIAGKSDSAAAATADRWTERQLGRRALGDHPDLWGSSTGLIEELQVKLENWASGIASEIHEMGQNRKGVAKVASLGVNVVGTGAIIAVFAHTGGLTGTEAGIAAVTAVLNQALLEAIFGEGNVAAFVKRSRLRLDEIVATAIDSELRRFEIALADQQQSALLGDAISTVAGELEAVGSA